MFSDAQRVARFESHRLFDGHAVQLRPISTAQVPDRDSVIFDFDLTVPSADLVAPQSQVAFSSSRPTTHLGLGSSTCLPALDPDFLDPDLIVSTTRTLHLRGVSLASQPH